jgi:hypothetical protein
MQSLLKSNVNTQEAKSSRNEKKSENKENITISKNPDLKLNFADRIS